MEDFSTFLSIPVATSLLSTRCFPMQACGIGTGFQESLPSYLNRMAVAHSVPVAILLSREVCPRLGDGEFKAGAGSHYLASLSRRLLAGVGYSSRIADVLVSLTGVESLRALSHQHSDREIGWMRWFRDHLAWCPKCLAEWDNAGLPAYTPVLWALKPVVCCPVHKVRLVEECACGTRYYHLASRAWMPKCYICSTQLSSVPTEPSSNEDVLCAEMSAEFVAWSARLTGTVDVSAASKNIATAAGIHGKFVLEKALGLAKKTLRYEPRDNLHTSRLLALGVLLRLSMALNVKPSQFVTQPLGFSALNNLTPLCGAVLVSDRRKTGVTESDMLSALQTALSQPGYPASPERIADSLGVGTKTLYQKFPSEVKALVDRRRAFCHERFIATHTSQIAMVKESMAHFVEIKTDFTIAGALRYLGSRWVASRNRFSYLYYEITQTGRYHSNVKVSP